MSLLPASWFEYLGRQVLRHYLLAGAAFVVLCATVGLGVLRLEADFSARAFFGGDVERLAQLDAHQARWGADDGVVIVTAQVRRGSVLERECLEDLENLARAIEDLPGVAHTVGLHNIRLPQERGGALAFLTPLEA
ncbi:MAG: hypothetical protein ACO3JL_17700, partial [Myxococcota bacterium]